MDNKTSDLTKGRQHDFKFVVVLLLVLAALLKLTLSFPMSGSYGGVENQWYVSPALFPLSLIVLMILCCLSLMVSAIKQGGHTNFLSLAGWLGSKTNQYVVDRWLIIGLLIAYVYIYIPATDFYLATSVFVISLTTVFYLKLGRARGIIGLVNLCLIIGLVTIRTVLNDDPTNSLLDINSIDQSILWCDIFTACLLAAIILWQFSQVLNQPKSMFVYQLIASLVVPLVLIIAFSFLLFVPMPVEYGSVINFLNWLAYEQLGL